MKSDNFIVIQGWMVNELNLKGNDLLVFALIYGFTRDGRTKFASGRNYIAESLNITLPTVDKALQNLMALNYIIKIPCENQSDTDKYYANISSKGILLPENISSKETLPKKYNREVSNTQQEIFTTNKENKEVNKKEDTYKEQVEKFVADYNSICKSLPKCVRMTINRGKAIIKILKKYSYDEVITVFNKLEASDFCKGNNQNGWRATIDFILREDKFVNVLEGKYDNKGRRNNFERISRGEKYSVSDEEKEEMRKAVERGDLQVY